MLERLRNARQFDKARLSRKVGVLGEDIVQEVECGAAWVQGWVVRGLQIKDDSVLPAWIEVELVSNEECSLLESRG